MILTCRFSQENGTPQNHDGTSRKNGIFHHGSGRHEQSMVCTSYIARAVEIYKKKFLF
jgi:hypothetical protein